MTGRRGEALGVRDQTARPQVERLADYLAARARALPVDQIADLVEGRFTDPARLLQRSNPGSAGQSPDVRYRLLDTIREYGLETLRTTGEEPELRRRHRDYYLRLARRFDTEWCGPDQPAWCARLTREHANVLDFSARAQIAAWAATRAV